LLITENNFQGPAVFSFDRGVTGIITSEMFDLPEILRFFVDGKPIVDKAAKHDETC